MQKAMSVALITVGLFLAVVAGPPEIETIMVAMQADQFQPTTAEVTDVRTVDHQKGPSTEVVEFNYEVDGHSYHGDNHLTQFDDSREEIEARIEKVDGEEIIEVYYDLANPEHVLLHRDVGLWVPIGILLATVACLYLGVTKYLEVGRLHREREQMRSRS